MTLHFDDTDNGAHLAQRGTGGGATTVVQPIAANAYVAAAITSTFALPFTIDLRGGNDTRCRAPAPRVPLPGDDPRRHRQRRRRGHAVGQTFAALMHVDGGDGFDSLEDLVLIPAANVSNVEIRPLGLPTYTEQGPGPIERNPDPTLAIPGKNSFAPVTGAVQSVVVHPFNPQIVYLGTVNGGVWLSENAGGSWRPLTDRLPSLSIGSIAIGVHDREGALVNAGTAREATS